MNIFLFGYNVFIGLKKETKVEDVFSLYKLIKQNDQLDIQQAHLKDSFLNHPVFLKDFKELYHYYKHTHLQELTVKNGKLLMGFQIGEKIEDIRVFRWALSPDGKSVEYIDNRGERDIQLPPAYDFEWTQCTREDVVHGRHPHINILDTVFVETQDGNHYTKNRK